jgi:hypothetical protein
MTRAKGWGTSKTGKWKTLKSRVPSQDNPWRGVNIVIVFKTS